MHVSVRVLALSMVLSGGLGLSVSAGLGVTPLRPPGGEGRDIARLTPVAGEAAGRSDATPKDQPETETPAQTSPPATPKRLSRIEQRKRAALQQQLLLQQKSLRQQNETGDRQQQSLRQQQDQALRDQRDIQRRQLFQQHQALRRLHEPQRASGQPPRLGPVDRPLIEQQNPTCGVPNTPLCR